MISCYEINRLSIDYWIIFKRKSNHPNLNTLFQDFDTLNLSSKYMYLLFMKRFS